MTIRILIVDDERTTRTALAEAFGQRGYDVEVAAAGDEALSLIMAAHYDAVLLDMQMPGLTGDQLLLLVKEVAVETAFVVLTAYASADTAITALRSGAVDYLRKPSPLQTILQTVAQAVEKKKNARQQRQAAQLLAQIRETLAMTETAVPPATSSPANNPCQVGNLRLDENSQSITYHNQPLDLTPVEYRLLKALMHQPDTVLAYADLSLLSHEIELEEEDARLLLRTHLYRLRQKIRLVAADPIQIIRGRGVMLPSQIA
ncbi:MAG: response regulator transcription factor [Anaerolineales bacterium]|nr:response regulator transcription factor [Anaerolineales bacterium]